MYNNNFECENEVHKGSKIQKKIIMIFFYDYIYFFAYQHQKMQNRLQNFVLFIA